LFFSVLPENSAEVEFIETTHGVVPKGSLLAYQLSKEPLPQKRKPINQNSESAKKQKESNTPKQLTLTPKTIALYKRWQEKGYDILDPHYKAWLDEQPGNSTTCVVADTFQPLPSTWQPKSNSNL